MDPSKEFMEELASQMDYWVEKLTESLMESADLSWTEQPHEFVKLGKAVHGMDVMDSFKVVIKEGLRGYIHSMLTALDGGTKLADRVKITVVDDKGQSLGPGLHERFVDHLLDTDRL